MEKYWKLAWPNSFPVSAHKLFRELPDCELRNGRYKGTSSFESLFGRLKSSVSSVTVNMSERAIVKHVMFVLINLCVNVWSLQSERKKRTDSNTDEMETENWYEHPPLSSPGENILTYLQIRSIELSKNNLPIVSGDGVMDFKWRNVDFLNLPACVKARFAATQHGLVFGEKGKVYTQDFGVFSEAWTKQDGLAVTLEEICDRWKLADGTMFE